MEAKDLDFLTVTVEQKITLKELEDTIVTAMEGGINGWAIIDSDEFYDKMQFVNSDLALSERISKEIYFNPDFVVNVYDAEELSSVDAETGEEEKVAPVGTLTRANAERGFRLLAEKRPDVLQRIVEGNADAGDADLWFQYAVLGEYTYNS